MDRLPGTHHATPHKTHPRHIRRCSKGVPSVLILQSTRTSHLGTLWHSFMQGLTRDECDDHTKSCTHGPGSSVKP